MHRERLAEQLELLERRPELAGAGCHVRLFPRRTLSRGITRVRALAPVPVERGRRTPRALHRVSARAPSLFLRREVLERFPYRDPGWPEDYDLVLRILAAGEKLGVVPKARHLWRDGPTRLSRTGPPTASSASPPAGHTTWRVTSCATRSGSCFGGYGDTGRVLCRLLAEEGREPTHIVELHPGRVGQVIRGASDSPRRARVVGGRSRRRLGRGRRSAHVDPKVTRRDGPQRR